MTFELDEMEVAELRRADLRRAQWFRRLREHPSCSDPDHPGCDRCDDTEPDEETES